ncbi:MAG TPA: Spy/CpxP family protein refolding chaperone [Stellaceae bacterium]|nr:Spy/CpxP family protein refolding chaperone [Stellaceae bacterium]
MYALFQKSLRALFCFAVVGLLMGAPSMAATSHADRVEARIKALHDRLRVTDAQSNLWDAVAQAMRDDANTMHDLVAARRAAAKTKPMTAVDDLNSYHEITQAHADGVKKLATAFAMLYDTMTPEQKQNADTVFAQFNHKRHQKGAAK